MPTYTVQAVLTLEVEAKNEDEAIRYMFETLLLNPSAQDFTVDVVNQVRPEQPIDDGSMAKDCD